MTDARSIFEAVMQEFALRCLAICVMAMIFYYASQYSRKLKIPIRIFSFLFCLSAGAKYFYLINLFSPDPEIKYVYDTGSYVTNSYVHLEFKTIGLPDEAPIIFGFLPGGSTNEADFVTVLNMTRLEWVDQYANDDEAVVTDVSWGFNGEATQYQWYLGTTYVAPPSVHTNGVLNCYGLKTLDGNALPKKTLVIEHCFLTYPPKQMGSYYDSVHDALNAEEFEGERIPYDLEQ